MTKKKRFGISAALTRGLSETINVVENNNGHFRNVILPLSRIELDPNNPRKLALNLNDIRTGIKADDPLLVRKQEEIEKIKELAHTIKSSGVINPIVVYKLGEVYRVVAGERRCLASILAGKQEIEARVFTDKPKGFELKLIQWIENTAREDLTLEERLGNVRDMLKEYQHQEGISTITATLLKTITGLSLSQCSYYLSALNAPQDVWHHISNGNIRNLDKAALLANIELNEVRQAALDACISGASLKEIRNLISHQKAINRKNTTIKFPSPGRSAKKINMGVTLNPTVIKTLIDSVVSQKSYSKFNVYFAQVNWNDFRQASKAFRKMVELLEQEIV